LFVAYWLDRAFPEIARIGRPATTSDLPKDTELAAKLFLKAGGFSSLAELNGRQVIRLISDQGLLRELSYVYSMVDFMCRKYEFRPDVSQRVELARAYVLKNEHDPIGTFSESKIEKIWNQYRSSAPYIYALYRYLAFINRRKASINDLAADLITMSKEHHVRRILGYAAYATDRIAVTRMHGVRERDFDEIPRVRPPLRHFTWENALVDGFDRSSAIR
jgi:hypothetical protein